MKGFGFGLEFGRVGKGGASYDPDATSLFARMTVQPNDARKALINSTILNLKTSGVWPGLKVLIVMAAHDAQAARLNWIADEYNLQPVNSPVFTVDRGYAGDGSSAYFNTGFSPASAPSPKYTQNSGHLAAYNRTSRGAAAQQILGASDGVNGAIQLASTQGAGQALLRVNDSGAGVTNGAGNQGFWHADRASSGTARMYRNGALFATNTVASAAVANIPVWVGAINSNGSIVSPTSDQIAMIGIGASEDTRPVAYYNAIQAYMTAVGAAV